jgi:hypothetical protein
VIPAINLAVLAINLVTRRTSRAIIVGYVPSGHYFRVTISRSMAGLMPSGQVPGRYAAPSIDPRDGGHGRGRNCSASAARRSRFRQRPFQADRYVGADGRLFADDVVQGLARHAQDHRRTLDCQFSGSRHSCLTMRPGWSGFFMGMVLFPSEFHAAASPRSWLAGTCCLEHRCHLAWNEKTSTERAPKTWLHPRRPLSSPIERHGLLLPSRTVPKR